MMPFKPAVYDSVLQLKSRVVIRSAYHKYLGEVIKETPTRVLVVHSSGNDWFYKRSMMRLGDAGSRRPTTIELLTQETHYELWLERLKANTEYLVKGRAKDLISVLAPHELLDIHNRIEERNS